MERYKRRIGMQMEEATTATQPESGVDVDDLVFALGQGVIYKMSVKKRDERVAKNIKILVDETQVAKTQLEASEREKATKVASLQSSNDQLGAKVIKLGDRLREVNDELATSKKAVVDLEKQLKTVGEDVVKYMGLCEEAQKELDRRDKISARRRKRKA